MGCMLSFEICACLHEEEFLSHEAPFSPIPDKSTSTPKPAETPAMLRARDETINHPCSWTPEMGPMKVWMDVSIHGERQSRIVVDLMPELAPRACENFRVLARRDEGKGYKGCVFHRIEPGFLAQAGAFGPKFGDEISRDTPKHARYVVCMANYGPNTNNTQFYIALGEAPWRMFRRFHYTRF